MKDVARELLAVARELLARTLKVDEKDNLEREFKKALRDGVPVEFEYTKKDGSKKKREVTPVAVFKMKGRMAVKGVEVSDRSGREKVFYLDMIGDVGGGDSSDRDPTERQILDLPAKDWTNFLDKAKKDRNLVRLKYKGKMLTVNPIKSAYDGDWMGDGYRVGDMNTGEKITMWYRFGDLTTPEGRLPPGQSVVKDEILDLKGSNAKNVMDFLNKATQKGEIIRFYYEKDRSNHIFKPNYGSVNWAGKPEGYFGEVWKNGKWVDKSFLLVHMKPVGKKTLDMSLAKTMSTGDLYKTLVKANPEVGMLWDSGDAGRARDVLEMLWDAVNEDESVGPFTVGTSSSIVEGPYGSMEKVLIQEQSTVVWVKNGKLETKVTQGDSYWRDDEGNTWRD
jgi:hypothetical protein